MPLEFSEVLALDIGGSKLALAQVDQNGTIRNYAKTPTAAIKTGCDIVQWVHQIVEEWGIMPQAMGISTGGPIDDIRGIVTRMPRMEMLWEYPLADEFMRSLPSLKIIKVVNDACAACAGEVLFGAAQGLGSVLYLTISTGIGGGAFIGGILQRGDRGNVAEFGHSIVQPGGPRCDCGAQGCLEAVASASGIYHQLVSAGLIEPQDRGWADLGPWLKEKLAQKDEGVWSFWNQGLAGLATGLVNLWNCYVPQAIVIGGGLSALVQSNKVELDLFIKERACLMPIPSEVIRFSENRHTIPLLGAAAVAGSWIIQD